MDNWNDLAVSYGRDMSAESIIAENPRTKQVFRVSQLQSIDLDKYLEDVRQGVYPLTAWGVESPTTSLLTTPAQSTRDEGESFGLGDDFEEDFVNEVETRLIMACMCTIRGKHDSPVASVSHQKILDYKKLKFGIPNLICFNLKVELNALPLTPTPTNTLVACFDLINVSASKSNHVEQ